MVICRTTIIGA